MWIPTAPRRLNTRCPASLCGCTAFIILPGITIGKYLVVGAGSVVTKDVPDYTIAAGNPCKPIRKIDAHDKEYYWKDRRFDDQH